MAMLTGTHRCGHPPEYALPCPQPVVLSDLGWVAGAGVAAAFPPPSPSPLPHRPGRGGPWGKDLMAGWGQCRGSHSMPGAHEQGALGPGLEPAPRWSFCSSTALSSSPLASNMPPAQHTFSSVEFSRVKTLQKQA